MNVPMLIKSLKTKDNSQIINHINKTANAGGS